MNAKIMIAALISVAPFKALGTDKEKPPAPPFTNPAPVVVKEKWTGEDKALHLVGGILISGVTTVGTGKPIYGFFAGCGFGLAKELADRSSTGFSGKDLVVTCLGAGLGAYGGYFLLTRDEGKMRVSYFKDF